MKKIVLPALHGRMGNRSFYSSVMKLSELAKRVNYAEEIHESMGSGESVFKSGWPEFKEDMLQTDTVVVPVQINGKLRSTIEMPRALKQDKVKELVLKDEKIKSQLAGKDIRKWIVLEDKLVNIVV